MSEPKFCKDCVHYVQARTQEYSRCKTVRHLVTGEPDGFADLERSHGKCGHKGKLFVSKDWPFPEKEPERARWKLWLARVIGL